MLFWPALQHLFTALGVLTSMFKTSAQLRLETLALRQQLTVSRRSAPERLKLTPADRFFFRVWLRAFGVTGNPPDDRQDGDSGRLASQGLPPVLDVESPLRQARSLTAYPTAEWTAQQLREAFPSGSAPRYLLRDRDQVFVQSHAITHAMWTHGHSMQIEFPDRLESVWRAGSYIQLTGNAGSDNRLHFAIPNPVIVDDHRLKLPPFVQQQQYVDLRDSQCGPDRSALRGAVAIAGTSGPPATSDIEIARSRAVRCPRTSM